jgi:predicted amidohydrolase
MQKFRKLNYYVKYKRFLFLLCGIVFCITACDESEILTPFSQYWKQPPKYDNSNATRTINVASVALEIDLAPEKNRTKIVHFIDKIKSEKPNVRLILFSEATLGYYYKSPNPAEYQQSIAETIPGETTDIISQKAIEHNIFISFGIVEKADVNLYNSQVLIAPDGNIMSIYHKIHLTPEDKENGCIAGKDIALNVIDNIKVATIICADLNNLAVNQQIHKSGAELVLISVASERTTLSDNWYVLQNFYAWSLGANRVDNEDGRDYDGYLFLNAPSGENRVKMNRKEGYIYGEVKLW